MSLFICFFLSKLEVILDSSQLLVDTCNTLQEVYFRAPTLNILQRNKWIFFPHRTRVVCVCCQEMQSCLLYQTLMATCCTHLFDGASRLLSMQELLVLFLGAAAQNSSKFYFVQNIECTTFVYSANVPMSVFIAPLQSVKTRSNIPTIHTSYSWKSWQRI